MLVILGGIVGTVVLVVIISAIASGGIGATSSSPVLVLSEFSLNENNEQFLKISGRTAGFMGWLKSIIGIGNLTSFSCSKQEVKYESSGIKYNIPLRHIACVSSGIKKPILLLILGIIFIIAAFAGASIHSSIILVGLIVGVVFIILYALNKNMQFSIFTGENRPIISIRVKGQGIDFDKFTSASNALNKTVLEVK
jgi:hypothetical protein